MGQLRAAMVVTELVLARSRLGGKEEGASFINVINCRGCNTVIFLGVGAKKEWLHQCVLILHF